MAIIHSPSKEIIQACGLIDEGIGHFIKAANELNLGTYEYQMDCLINIAHALRILESITELARKDLVHIQSAMILSRPIFEALIKVFWVLVPSDHFEKECRYVAILDTEIEFWAKWIKELSGLGPDDLQKAQDQHRSFSQFRKDLAGLLQEKGYSIPKQQDMRSRLKSIGEERKYLYYILLSQYTHLTHHSGQVYRKT